MGILYLKRAQQTSQHAAARHRHAQNCFVVASGYLEDNRLEEARALLQRGLQYDHGHLPSLRALTNLEFSFGNLDLAREYLKRIMEYEEREQAETLFLQGNIELHDGNLTEALEKYQRAAELGDRTPELDFNTGLTYLMLGHGAQAREIFERMVEEDAGNARAWDALGCALRLEKENPAAMQAFQQALQIDSQQHDTRDHLAQLLLEMGDPQQARQVLETALSYEPERVTSRHMLGLVFATLQDFPQAISCWEELVALDCALPETYHLLANAYLQQHNRYKAIATLKMVLALRTYHLPAHLQLALLLMEQGDIEEAWHHLEQAQALDPQNPTVVQLINAANAIKRHESGEQ
jgi:tetratricopeptide (TPR) repeat protein